MSGVFAIWALSGYLLFPQPDRGTFGDMFGAVNALFSGMAFAGVIYTVLLQRQALQLQREELQATRLELARSAAAQERSEHVLQLQAEAAEYGQRLSAVNHMLEFAELCQRRLQAGSLNQAEEQQCMLWAERRTALVDELDRVFMEVVARRRSTKPISQERNPRTF